MTYDTFRNDRLRILQIECGERLEVHISAPNATSLNAGHIRQAIMTFIDGFHFLPEELILPAENVDGSDKIDVVVYRDTDDVREIMTNVRFNVLGIRLSGALSSAQGVPRSIKILGNEALKNGVVARYTMPLCLTCHFQQRLANAATQQEKNEILREAVSAGPSILKQLKDKSRP